MSETPKRIWVPKSDLHMLVDCQDSKFDVPYISAAFHRQEMKAAWDRAVRYCATGAVYVETFEDWFKQRVSK